jgi:hypothetical protein
MIKIVAYKERDGSADAERVGINYPDQGFAISP